MKNKKTYKGTTEIHNFKVLGYQGKRVLTTNGWYRLRRGKWALIPEEWVGVVHFKGNKGGCISKVTRKKEKKFDLERRQSRKFKQGGGINAHRYDNSGSKYN